MNPMPRGAVPFGRPVSLSRALDSEPAAPAPALRRFAIGGLTFCTDFLQAIPLVQLDVAKMFGSGNGIHQGADTLDAYADLVGCLQREGIRRNDSGACEQEAAVRETVVAKKIFD